MEQITIKTYDTQAQDYDVETSSFWDRFPKTFFNQFISLADNKTVLDVGSGPGRDGLILQRLGIDVTCLDASQSMVNICSQRGLRSVLGDFNNLPFGDSSFDSAWAYTSLLHVPKKSVSLALNEISRVLKPAGVLGLGMIEGDSEGYIQSHGVNMPRWFSYYKEDEISQLLKFHKFNVTYFEKFKPGSRNYLNFICTKG